MYGREMWTMTKHNQESLKRCEIKILRMPKGQSWTQSRDNIESGPTNK